MVREKERAGGWEGREEKLARYTKAEVGVVFPVNTELQRVRGERFSDGYAEEHAAWIQNARLILKMDLSSAHTHQAIFLSH